MRTLVLDRLTAWICLALVSLTGLTPTQGFVICIEADGCVSVELKATDGNCGGCAGHDEADSTLPEATSSSDQAECPCIDIAVPGVRDDQLARGRSLEIKISSWIVPTESVRVAPAFAVQADRRGPPDSVPRVADSLAHIRTVVLLV